MTVTVVGAEHCRAHSIELTVSEKKASLSGESYEIADADGNCLFKMDGHAFSVRDKCTLLNREGCPVLTARKKLMSMHDTWEVYAGDKCEAESRLFEVKKSSFFQLKTSLDVLLNGNSNDDCPDFRIKGNFFEREAQILKGETVIAEVKRKFSVGNVIMDKHVFCVEVRPHIDLAFIATLIVILHEISDD